jgi:hypothetical protein
MIFRDTELRFESLYNQLRLSIPYPKCLGQEVFWILFSSFWKICIYIKHIGGLGSMFEHKIHFMFPIHLISIALI